MNPLAISIVSVVSIFVLLPAIVVGGVLGGRFLKLKERELGIREKELETERERLQVLKLMEANDALERSVDLRRP